MQLRKLFKVAGCSCYLLACIVRSFTACLVAEVDFPSIKMQARLSSFIEFSSSKSVNSFFCFVLQCLALKNAFNIDLESASFAQLVTPAFEQSALKNANAGRNYVFNCFLKVQSPHQISPRL